MEPMGKNIIFFSFPAEEELGKQWIQVIRRDVGGLVWISYNFVLSSCHILIDTVACKNITVYSQVKTVNNCHLTSPLTVLFFNSLYLSPPGNFSQNLRVSFPSSAVPLYQTKHQGYHLCLRKPNATKPLSYTLTENDRNKNAM